MSDAKKEFFKNYDYDGALPWEVVGYIKELEKQNKILLSGIKNQLQKGLSRYRTIKMIEEATGLSIEKFFEKTEDLK